MTTVRSHQRRDRRGEWRPVRTHTRSRRVTVRLTPRSDEDMRDDRGTYMFTDPEQRGVIFVNSDPESGDVESWLSHETLHNVLNDHGEVNASYAIDERRDEDTPNPENTGLYYWTPRPRRAR